jgi:2-polyprenyl-3-methyl-5-hydroxy-6-metoxy-1,4-benzoquinol methylase
MVATYETWAEHLSALLAKAALKRTSVRAGDRVLDIGAGTGAFALRAAALGARVTAIDISSGGNSPMDQGGRAGRSHS